MASDIGVSKPVRLQGDARLEILVEPETFGHLESGHVEVTRLADGETIAFATSLNRHSPAGVAIFRLPGAGREYTISIDAEGFRPSTIETGPLDPEPPGRVELSVGMIGDTHLDVHIEGYDHLSGDAALHINRRDSEQTHQMDVVAADMEIPLPDDGYEYDIQLIVDGDHVTGAEVGPIQGTESNSIDLVYRSEVAGQQDNNVARDSQPGFGPLAAAGSLIGGTYLLSRRSSNRKHK